ncbi:MAG: hypothetical protein KA116_08145 [Proteobacteria bacterium]|nr:hypothetical protein [Pseudomonadota bacterium]
MFKVKRAQSLFLILVSCYGNSVFSSHFSPPCQEAILLNNLGAHQLFQIVERSDDFWQKPKSASQRNYLSIVHGRNQRNTSSRPVLILNTGIKDKEILQLRTQSENGSTYLYATLNPGKGYGVHQVSGKHVIEESKEKEKDFFPSIISAMSLSLDTKFFVYAERLSVNADSSATRLNFLLSDFLMKSLNSTGPIGELPRTFQSFEFPDTASSDPNGFTEMGFSPNGKFFVAMSATSLEIFYYNGTIFNRLDVAPILNVIFPSKDTNVFNLTKLEFSKDSLILKVDMESPQIGASPKKYQIKIDLSDLKPASRN